VKILLRISLLAIAASVAAQRGSVLTVEKVSVLNGSPFQLQIRTSRPSVPQVQMVSNPDRLVIDIPNSAPGLSLRGLPISRDEVRGVRVSRYSDRPPTTRVVVDLNAPEWYRVAPNDSGLLVTLGSGSEGKASAPAIGWLSTRTANRHTAPAVLRKAAVTASPSVNGVTVQFASGLLTIHARNATLSEVLFQIQKITGAEIAIPSGTEQEHVASDFGPGTPSEVLGELLNGSGLNFVVVGSASDPNQLRSVILSRYTGGPDPPSAFASADEAQVSAPVIEPGIPDPSEPPPENAPPQPQPSSPPPN
jgi:AMIN domain